jgi:aspartyl aminopeptidase
VHLLRTQRQGALSAGVNVSISDFTDHLASCPTALHVADRWTTALGRQGYRDAATGWTEAVLEKGFVRRRGAIVAWRNMGSMVDQGVRIVGAHTDSPGLHLKPRQGRIAAGQSMLEVEVYGGPLLSSWADRDLGLAGHVVLTNGETRLFSTSNPIARIPLLAIHLDRDVNERGLILDRHNHLSPMWGEGHADIEEWLADEIGLPVTDIVSWAAELADTQPPAFLGRNGTYLAASRLDNQVSCWAAMTALIAADTADPSMVALFDHEEVGSSSATGASGPLLEQVLERLCITAGGNRESFLTVLDRSHCVSADNSHALHPNHQDRHHEQHAPLLNEGVAIKTNSNQRYASDSGSVVPILAAFQRVNRAPQWFSSKNTIPCGSTIGPLTATRLGIPTIDIGVPQLSMHSIREVCGASDVLALRELLVAYWAR